MTQMPAHVLLLCAPRGAGKTTACSRLVRLAGSRGLQVAGILTVPVGPAENPKRSLAAHNIATGEQRLLAEEWSQCATPAPPEAPRTGRYRFCPETLAWALEELLAALQRPCDLVVVDEVGPLELVQGRGYAPVLDRLPEATPRAVLLVVREELGDALAERLRHLGPQTVRLSAENRDTVPDVLLSLLVG